MDHWDDVDPLLRRMAEHDLEAGDGVRPTVIAFVGDHPLLMVRCRAFAPGAGGAALGEVVDAAVPLGADRLAASFGGRAWSLAGDGAPTGRAVTPVLSIVTAERHAGGPQVRCTVRSMARGRCGPVLLDSVDDGAATGWPVATLSDALAGAPVDPPDLDLAATRMARCLTLGHELHLPDDGAQLSDHPARHARSAHGRSGAVTGTGRAVAPPPRFDTRR